jgi:hypothetical protein
MVGKGTYEKRNLIGSARKISAERRFLKKNKIILLLGLDFSILHQ